MSTHKGQQGEQQACDYLVRQGYSILARNVRIAPGEIDIIALGQQILAFIEVKSHQQRTASIQAMHQDKQRRIIRAASGWHAQHRQYSDCQCRFDVIIVIPAPCWQQSVSIEHMTDAFRAR